MQALGLLSYLMIGRAVIHAVHLEAADQPNVLLICIDDLKPALGCYGDVLAVTPNLDRIAAQGVIFDRAYCNQAVCSPSRNSLMTGLRPQSIGIYDLATHFRRGAPDAVTLGQYFKLHGYTTESIGKIFHVAHGNVTDADSWSNSAWYHNAKLFTLSKNSSQRPKDGPRVRAAAFESEDVPDNVYGDGLIAEEAVRRIRVAAEQPNTPFFLAVGFIRPHLPFVAPRRYWDLHDPNKFSLAEFQDSPRGAPEYAPHDGDELRLYRDIPIRGDFTPDLQRRLLHGYYAATSYTDAQVGKVLDELERLNLKDQTLVVIWGDHGWHLGDHGMWAKHSNYEQAARIPLILAGPGISPGARTSSLVETVDIYPTLAELAGFAAPEKVDGKSFASVLRNPRVETRDHAIHVFPRRVAGKGDVLGRAIRTSQYRLVEWKVPGEDSDTAEFELYDYVNDPQETVNLAKSCPDIVKQLRELLRRHPEALPQLSVESPRDQQDDKSLRN